MPTRLPSRRSFLRRFAIEPDAARNVGATILEFACAVLFVGVTVLAILRLDVTLTQAAAVPLSGVQPPVASAVP